MSGFTSNDAKVKLYADIKLSRKHLLRDLQPYSCPFDDCGTSQTFYTEKQDLVQHFEKDHLTAHSFTCLLCEDSDNFDSTQDLKSHLLELHKDDLLEEDIQATVDASTHWEIDWPELCPICQDTLFENQSTTDLLKEHLRKKHIGDVLDEEVEPIVEDAASPFDNCPKCNDNVGQASSSSRLVHLSRCLHEFALRALPWNDQINVTKRPFVEKLFHWTDQSTFKEPAVITAPDQPATPPEIDKENLDKLQELFPSIHLSDHPVQEADTFWRQDLTLLETSETTSSTKVRPLEDHEYFGEEHDNPACSISDELLDAFDRYLQFSITSIASSEHANAGEMIDELNTLRKAPLSDAQLLQSAFLHLGRSDGFFRGFDKTLLLNQDAQLQVQRLSELTILAQDGDARYVMVSYQSIRVLT